MRPLRFISSLLILLMLLFLSCENNIYIDSESDDLWSVNGKYFSSLQSAVNYILNTTKGAKSIGDVPAGRTVVLQRNVMNGERGGGLYVPKDFTGLLNIDFNGHTYEFDDSLSYFFNIQGGDEIYITNGTTVIHEETASRAYAIMVNTDSVTIDAHLVDDRRADPSNSSVSDARLLEVGENGHVVLENIESSDSATMKGAISVITDGNSGGKLEINKSRVVLSNIYSSYRDSDGNVSNTIPESTNIPEAAKTDITIHSGHVSIDRIATLSDYFIDNGAGVAATLFKKARLNIFGTGSLNGTTIDNPHDSEEIKIDTAISTIIGNSPSGGTVEHGIIHNPIEKHSGYAPTCTEEGMEDYWECEACGKLFKTPGCEPQNEIASPVMIPALGHQFGSKWYHDGSYHWHVCERDETHLSEKEAHSFTEWTYDPETGKSSRYCTICGRREEEDHEHALAHFDRVPHTASTPGNIEYWYCSECGKKYSDAQGTVEITDTADPHVLVHHAAVLHTCTVDGNIEYYECSVCGQFFTDEACTTAIDDITDPARHHGVHVAAVAATCTTAGNIEYWHCSVCGKYFSDESCTTEITQQATVIAATGHTSEYSHDADHHWIQCEHCNEILNYGDHVWGELELSEDEHHLIRRCSVCGASKVEKTDNSQNLGIFTIEMPVIIPDAPCGDLTIANEGNIYTVKYKLSVDSEKPDGVVCRYRHNGAYSNYLENISTVEGEWKYTFTANGSLPYKVQVQSYNDGGNMTLERIVNN